LHKARVKRHHAGEANRTAIACLRLMKPSKPARGSLLALDIA